MTMEVVVAEHAGACYGVQRALDMAQGLAREGRRSFTLGPLIHNPLVVKDLARSGVECADAIGDLPAGEACPVVIRSHGVTPEVRRRLEETGLPIHDATCPHVLRAQRAAAQLAASGCRVIVVGEAGHPEVEGLVAYARREGAEVLVASSPEDLPDALAGSIGVVVQTTQRRAVLEEVLEALRARGIDPVVRDTICDATRERQDAALDLAGRVDAVVVVGGRNSSNTARLAEICQGVCARTYLVQQASELDRSWFTGCRRIGVSAGASTPESHIAEVVAWLEQV